MPDDSKKGALRRFREAFDLPDPLEGMRTHHVAFVALFQLVVLAASMGICIGLGATPLFWGSALLVFALTCGWLLVSMAALARPSGPGAHERFVRRSAASRLHAVIAIRARALMVLMKSGVWATSIAFLLVAVAILERVDWQGEASAHLPAIGICVALVLFSVLSFKASRYAMQHGSTPWLQFTTGVTLIPFLGAWLVASLAAAYVEPHFLAGFGDEDLKTEHDAQLRRRAQWATHSAWRKADGTPLVVAVALSGGGYRAATFHAGVLDALDRHCVPIRYVSTVSGGSIIGTYYALGYSPGLFKRRLALRKPGLPDTMLTVWWVFADLLWPGWNSADTYSRHFSKTFFGDKTFNDTGTTPQLLINATDVERSASFAREVFYKDRDPSNKSLNEMPLSDFVAASGAFPGPFQPKQIEWPDLLAPEQLKTRKFSDGGVYENLGYTGLAVFSVIERSRRVLPAPPMPDVLILSDASAAAAETHLPSKVDVMKLLTRTSDISYQMQLDLLRMLVDANEERRPTGLGFEAFWVRVQYEAAEATVADKWFPSGQDRVPGKEVAKAVSEYATLKEFTPEMVARSFWLGQTLAENAWPQIDDWRRKLASGEACR